MDSCAFIVILSYVIFIQLAVNNEQWTTSAVTLLHAKSLIFQMFFYCPATRSCRTTWLQNEVNLLNSLRFSIFYIANCFPIWMIGIFGRQFWFWVSFWQHESLLEQLIMDIQKENVILLRLSQLTLRLSFNNDTNRSFINQLFVLNIILFHTLSTLL